MTVTEAAEHNIRLNIPGGYSGPFKSSLVPYMVEPANMLKSRKHKGLIFVGPAQSAKTQCLVDNWAGFTIMCDPADMIIVQTSQDSARDFSRRRIDRMHRNCEYLRERLSTTKKNDNTYDKHYKTGQILSFGWPSINILSGKAIKYMALTDYDRMPQDIDGEGSPYSLSEKRTTTFLSGGMTMAESSPGFEVLDTRWEVSPDRPHEAPPTKGILSLYNNGDRRRWQWPCPHCNEYFEPSFDLLVYEENPKDLISAANSVVMVCPHCASAIDQTCKSEMNKKGLWIIEGQKVVNGEIVGEARKSNIASYWLQGPAAAFQTWSNLVLNYLQAFQEYERTGSQETLKTTVNVDQGKPYYRINTNEELEMHTLEARAKEVPKKVVPSWVRFLLAAVDVQKGRFVVQVHGIGIAMEQIVLDRFNLAMSHRYDDNGESMSVSPGAYLQDWDLITEKVIKKDYPIEGTDKRMKILYTACDSGGEAGVTDNAYKYYRSLKKLGLHKRFMLVKGSASSTAPRIKKSFPDSTKQSNRKVTSFGDVPVWIINANLLKDSVAAMLSREKQGEGYIHFPQWLGRWFYEELTIEERTDKGWINPNKKRNEAFDLFCYIRALCIALKVESIDWNNPPKWAQIAEKNSMVYDVNPNKPEEIKDEVKRIERKPRKNNFVKGWK
jgi:phage terminase large subunit GpA-like protein